MQIGTSRRFDKRFKKQPKKIQNEFQKRIAFFINHMFDPLLCAHKLSGKFDGLWSFNVSADIRVVFGRSQEDIILLVDIGSHSELYS